MWKNYLKTAFRNLWKNRAHASVNLLGLSLGIAGSLVLYLYIQYHRNYEEHIPNADEIHRMTMSFEFQGEMVDVGFALVPAIDYIKTNISAVKSATFVDWINSAQVGLIKGERVDRVNVSEGIFKVDSSFFEVLPQQFVAGTAKGLLDNPQGAVISRKHAEEWYGSPENALGESFLLNNDAEHFVVGVIENPPVKTDLNFHMLLSTAREDSYYQELGWGYFSSGFQCFYTMQPGHDFAEVTQALNGYISEIDRFEDDFSFGSQALTAIHNNPELDGFVNPAVSSSRLWGLAAIACFLVLTACINFVNLSTALAVHRAKEVGIRKALGSARRQLVFQFLGETAVIVVLAIGISLVLAELALVQLDALLDTHIRIFSASSIELVGFLFLLGVLVVVVSGLYPAYIMSGFQPVKALKESPTRMATGKFSLRKVLVVIQFMISQGMIIATLVVILQSRYAMNKDLGMDPKAMMVVENETEDKARLEAFKSELVRVPGVLGVSLGGGPAASDHMSINSFTYQGERYALEYMSMDANFMDLYGIQLLAGEGIIEADSTTRCIVNEATLRRFGVASAKDMIGQTVRWEDRDLLVTGVVKDFHNHSIRTKIEPLVMFYLPYDLGGTSISVETANLDKTIAGVQAVWDRFFPESLMNYQFQDQLLEAFYETDRRLGQMFQIFSILAIVIGCLGLYGLSSFLITRKAKEIGVRKVLGASVNQILWMFSREYIGLVVVGFVLAGPVTYWGMSQYWLTDFVYRIPFTWWILLIGIIFTMVVALATVGYHSFRAAQSNPVRALKYE